MGKGGKKPDLSAYAKKGDLHDALARELAEEIRLSLKNRGTLPQRWRENEALYRNEPGRSNFDVIEDFTPYHVPLMQPLIDALIEAVATGPLSPSPLLQAIPST